VTAARGPLSAHRNEARLAEGLADIKAGRTFGPFDSADQMIAHMRQQVKKRAVATKTKRAR